MVNTSIYGNANPSVTITDNRNFLSQLNFRFLVKKIPNASFFVQRINVPGLHINSVPTPTPFVQIPQAGDHISYGELNLLFRVDEDLNNWLELYKWIRGEGFPDDFAEYSELSGGSQRVTNTGVKSDLTLMILNAQKNTSFEIVFREAFPIFLSDLIFNRMDQSVNYIEAETVFHYIDFQVNKLPLSS